MNLNRQEPRPDPDAATPAAFPGGSGGADHLPDFCAPGALLVLVLLGLILTLVVTLAGLASFEDFWLELGLSGLFILWVILTAAALLCALRGVLGRAGPRAAVWLAFGIIQAIVVAYSGVVIALPGSFGGMALLAAGEPELFLIRNLGISLVASFVLVRYLILRQRWLAQVAAESRARLNALQARIRPHFLFNALNTISELIRTRPEQAEEAVLDLSDLLRTGLRTEGRHSLAVELELARGYLRIEKLRLGERLAVDWDLDGNLPGRQQIPALLVQPLVENAVIHGIARMAEGGSLAIAARREGRRVRIAVENPVPGHKDGAGKALPAYGAGGREAAEGNRMALENIRQRLELAYGERARLKTAVTDGRFRVEMVLPVED